MVMTNQEKERIKQLEKELQDYKNKAILEPFIEIFSKSIMAYLAHTSYDDWPDFAWQALMHHQRDFPTSVTLYKSLLPQK